MALKEAVFYGFTLEITENVGLCNGYLLAEVAI